MNDTKYTSTEFAAMIERIRDLARKTIGHVSLQAENGVRYTHEDSILASMKVHHQSYSCGFTANQTLIHTDDESLRLIYEALPEFERSLRSSGQYLLDTAAVPAEQVPPDPSDIEQLRTDLQRHIRSFLETLPTAAGVTFKISPTLRFEERPDRGWGFVTDDVWVDCKFGQLPFDLLHHVAINLPNFVRMLRIQFNTASAQHRVAAQSIEESLSLLKEPLTPRS
jgi:hypothetical protein